MKSTTHHLTETTEFEAPGAGSWELDLAHFSPDCSRIARDAIEIAMSRGIEDGFDMVGAPVKTIEARFINGRFYRRLVPLVGASRNLPEPPPIALKIATRLHPGFRKRAKTAQGALAGRVWMDELDRWESTWKPDLIAASKQIGTVELSAIDDNELADLVVTANAHMVAGLILHFRLHISDLGPIGLLLVRGRDWGLDPVGLMQCLSGYSFATSAPAAALAGIATHLQGDVGSLAEVRRASPEAAEKLDAFLAEFGDRLTGGYDLADRTLAEMPDTILGGIRSAGSRPITDAAKQLGDRTADELRAQLPSEHRGTFDGLVADARALYGLRDENGPITYQWPAGLLRRIVLQAGTRLVQDKRIKHLDHVFDLSAAELAATLRGPSTNVGAVSASEAERRCTTRRSWLEMDAPRLLGPEPVIPPLEVLPASLAALMDIILTVLELIESPIERTGLSGVGVGQDRYVGRARVVSDAIDALAEFEPGDVLVTPFTVPTINAVLAMAGAVVTEEGGLLSHAAVIAREFGIPAVIGIDAATSTIPDGAMIEVNANTGMVTVGPPCGP